LKEVKGLEPETIRSILEQVEVLSMEDRTLDCGKNQG